jgi:hypothetical protein
LSALIDLPSVLIDNQGSANIPIGKQTTVLSKEEKMHGDVA